jgi:pimeloyl-ACP methyl ester carboxylesterase
MKLAGIEVEKVEKMVDAGGRKLHCRVFGEGSPTVVLISGLNAPQAYWNPIIPGICRKATVVTYDRPGYGKSETGMKPLHGEQAARDLRVLLEELDVPKPYVVVGHSYGGGIARLFASMYPGDMGGLILEDAQHESILDEQRNLLEGRDLEALEAMAARMGNTADPKTELDYMPATREQLEKSGPLPVMPFVVITSGDRSKAVPPMFSEQAREKLIELGMKLQKRLVALVPNGRHIIAEGVGHNIHVDKPAVLIDPLLEMIAAIEEGKE